MWEYKAELIEVIDGDTMDFKVDLGFNTFTKIRVRLANVDTHETYGVDHDSEEFRLGKIEEEFAKEWLTNSNTLILQTEKTGKYGRWIATITNRYGEELNQRLIDEFGVEQ